MWASGHKHSKKHLHQHRGGMFGFGSSLAGGESPAAPSSKRDDSVVITASAVASSALGSALGAGAGGGAGLGGGTFDLHPTAHALHAHALQAHALHGHGHGHGHSLVAGAGAGAGPPGPSGASGGGPSAGAPPSGLPYQRPNATSLATLQVDGSIDEAMARSAAASSRARTALCEGGLPDADMCALDPDLGLGAEEGGARGAGAGGGLSPVGSAGAGALSSPGPPVLGSPVVDEALSRGRWLLGLLIVQSTSSFVLDAYQDLLRDHLVVTLFLTMLVGAGGNAGNQSAIKVIRGLATGAIRPSWPSCRATLRDQSLVGLLLGSGLAVGGFVRVYATHGDVANAAAISVSLFLIVMISVVLGSGLPFVLARAGVDPANAGTSIQVLMDILGVAVTCVTCNFVLVQLAAGLTS
ncbi:hypothetical protein HYH03_009872 [Edaphochlamys debaryana]|uniref:SLC41A/MgtE integral membrane domain-containing protein n=1 Tax=Edaphochlamys debaryana TaxID=47281 RepID=A0A836BXZ3_9CHLO|nr:hypothetical protein HYH03_009872 [Edaphochlamys debaryana]|eukprot:KAG2491709.1 hypothetical protein HYH03_009872 [Edaphochlamys debaryana]